MIIPVILAGGAGSRLWPMSREHYPKQLLSFTDESTLLQNTVRRAQGLVDATDPMIICNQPLRFVIAEQLRALNVTPASLVLEPVGRNTAPATTIAALHALTQHEDPVLLVLPADHNIADDSLFQQHVAEAIEIAEQGHLVTFGIKPSYPETGYGYIKSGETLSQQNSYKIQHFVEKPDFSDAEAYLADGNYYWNSGCFLFKASQFITAIKRHAPDIFHACQAALQSAQYDMDFLRLDEAAFEACPSDSVDYAVMEKADNGAIVIMDVGWSDLGSWSSLWAVSDRDQQGNAMRGDVITEQVSNCYLHANSRLLAAVGLDNCAVIETADAVLVADLKHSQAVKQVVMRLNQAKRSEVQYHRRVHRPWGFYELIDEGPGFKVKRIAVKPQACLSLQAHQHRAEHWVVVKGTAEVTRDDEISVLNENESTFIPVGVKHRLANPGEQLLEIIEVQSGSYLGEDDIVRFADNYGRVS